MSLVAGMLVVSLIGAIGGLAFVLGTRMFFFVVVLFSVWSGEGRAAVYQQCDGAIFEFSSPAVCFPPVPAHSTGGRVQAWSSTFLGVTADFRGILFTPYDVLSSNFLPNIYLSLYNTENACVGYSDYSTCGSSNAAALWLEGFGLSMYGQPLNGYPVTAFSSCSGSSCVSLGYLFQVFSLIGVFVSFGSSYTNTSGSNTYPTTATVLSMPIFAQNGGLGYTADGCYPSYSSGYCILENEKFIMAISVALGRAIVGAQNGSGSYTLAQIVALLNGLCPAGTLATVCQALLLNWYDFGYVVDSRFNSLDVGSPSNYNINFTGK